MDSEDKTSDDKELNRDQIENTTENSEPGPSRRGTKRQHSQDKYDETKNQATELFNSRHMVNDGVERGDIMAQISECLQKNFGENWMEHFPVEILHDHEIADLLRKLPVGEEAKTRMENINEDGHWMDKRRKNDVQILVNTIVVSVLQEVNPDNRSPFIRNISTINLE